MPPANRVVPRRSTPPAGKIRQSLLFQADTRSQFLAVYCALVLVFPDVTESYDPAAPSPVWPMLCTPIAYS